MPASICLFFRFLYDFRSSYPFPFEVMGQDLLLHQGYLFVMPLAKNALKARKYEKVILLVLDPLNGSEMAKFQWETPRMPPEVYKESGETRLYANEGHTRPLVLLHPRNFYH